VYAKKGEVGPSGVQIPAVEIFRLHEQSHPSLDRQCGFDLRHKPLVVLIVQLAVEFQAQHFSETLFRWSRSSSFLLEKGIIQ